MLSPDRVISMLNLEKLMERLKEKSDFDERVKLTLKSIDTCKTLSNVQCEKKSNEESVTLRKQADVIMIRQKNDQGWFGAHELYSRSIAKAQLSSKELAQAYANRSAVLANLNKPQECIKDIDKALQGNNYPDHLKANLLRRKAKALKKIGDSNADAICEEARQWLGKVSLNDKSKEKLEMKINVATRNPDYDIPDIWKKEPQVFTLKLEKINENIPAAIDALDLKFNEARGRHLVANRDVRAGEVVIIEEPYAMSLNSKYFSTHCSHCLVRVWHSIPCNYCPNALYCSDKCRDEAWKKYHDIECRIKGYLLKLNMNNEGIFSVKLTIMAVREYITITKMRRELKKIDKCTDYLAKSLSKDGIYRSDQYTPIFNLLTHLHKRNSLEIISLSINASFILYYLYNLTPFLEEVGNVYEDADAANDMSENLDALFIGKLIAHHYMMIQVNSIDFDESRDNEYLSIGKVLGSVASLLNHSCDPNIGRCSIMKDNKAKTVFYALRPINKDVELVEDYGCRYSCASKSNRDIMLKHYFFKCDCIACRELWPQVSDQPSILPILEEKFDKEKLFEVTRAIIRSKQFESTICSKGLDKFHGDKMKILQTLATSINRICAVTTICNKEYTDIVEQFRATFWHIYGNKFEYKPFF